MKHLIFALLIPSFLAAQKDTIFTTQGKTIPCTITLVNSHNIFYTDKKGNAGEMISLTQVSKFSQNGSSGIAPAQESVKPFSELPSGQGISTVTVNIQDEINYMRLCMANHAREYFTGVGILIGGTVFSSAGGALIISGNKEIGPVLTVMGGLGTLVGAIITIDSHKWFKRASLGVGFTGASVKYVF